MVFIAETYLIASSDMYIFHTSQVTVEFI